MSEMLLSIIVSATVSGIVGTVQIIVVVINARRTAKRIVQEVCKNL